MREFWFICGVFCMIGAALFFADYVGTGDGDYLLAVAFEILAAGCCWWQAELVAERGN